jgi:hypothetical protein
VLDRNGGSPPVGAQGRRHLPGPSPGTNRRDQGVAGAKVLPRHTVTSPIAQEIGPAFWSAAKVCWREHSFSTGAPVAGGGISRSRRGGCEWSGGRGVAGGDLWRARDRHGRRDGLDGAETPALGAGGHDQHHLPESPCNHRSSYQGIYLLLPAAS